MAIFGILGRQRHRMWRSFLARSTPLLSGLRPIRPAHDLARSYSSGAERRRGDPNQPHLYVALEDSNGHALYKLNVDDLAGDVSDKDSAVATGVEKLHRLPRPVLRLSFRSFGKAQFNALGRKIVVTTGSLCDDRESSKCLTLVYDTKTRKQDIQAFVPDGLTGCYDALAAGNKLYACCPQRLPLYYLRDARAHPESDDDDDDDRDESESESSAELDDSDEEDDVETLREEREERWTWKRSPMSIPCGAGSAASVRAHTFYTTGRAVHPDGHTIFLSTFDNHRPRKEINSTFSMDTDQPGGGEWTRLGDWKLPFHGKAHYDSELDAWVAFTYSEDTGGQHLCSCDLPATGGNPTTQPAWRLCKEQLTFMQAPLSAMCRKLVHVGPGRFCLVELAPYIRFNDRRCLDVDKDLLQVTMFRARYGENGELMATALRPGRLYLISGYNPISIAQPPAFWM